MNVSVRFMPLHVKTHHTIIVILIVGADAGVEKSTSGKDGNIWKETDMQFLDARHSGWPSAVRTGRLSTGKSIWSLHTRDRNQLQKNNTPVHGKQNRTAPGRTNGVCRSLNVHPRVVGMETGATT